MEIKIAEFSPKSNILVDFTNGEILEKQISQKEVAEKFIKKFLLL